jgi:hypothetical protein
MAIIPLPLGSYQLAAPAASCRRLVNCFAEAAPQDGGKQPAILHRAPGILAWGDTGAVECRGGVVMGGVLYVCADDTLYSVASDGTETALTGDAITGNGPVRMESNGTTIVVCPGNGDGFSSDGSTVAEITDVDFVDGADPAFVDGYLVFRQVGTENFFNSGLDAITFNGLDITNADGAPDNLVGLIANNRELILPGERSTERWYNAGLSPGSPFARSPNGFYEIGCAAGQSLLNQDNTALMLANDLTFRRLGASWERVSQHGIETVLQDMDQVSDCYGMAYRQGGHHFAVWTFPNAGRTLCLDLNTQEWAERESRIDTVSIGRWRPAFIIEAYGKQIVGDSQSGQLGILDPDTHEEFGEPQVMEFQFQPLYAQNRSIQTRSFELGIAAGQGTISGQGSNPLCTLFISRDGGNTFIAKATRSIGRIGQYRRRVRWGGLGAASQLVPKIQLSDPVRTLVLDAIWEGEGARI